MPSLNESNNSNLFSNMITESHCGAPFWSNNGLQNFQSHNGNASSSMSYMHGYGQTLPDMATLGAASHDVLMRSGNQAYTALFQENIQLKADLSAQRSITAHISTFTSNLALSHGPIPLQTTSQVKLEQPELCPPSSKINYPNVSFWTKEEWTTYENRNKTNGTSYHKLRFVTTESGEMVSDQTLKNMTETAKKIWNQLYHDREDPPVWKSKSINAGIFYSKYMRAHHEEFRWCHDNWKVEQFAINRYPDWARYFRSSGKLQRANPSIGKGKGSNVSDKQKKKERNEKIRQEKVVEIDSDTESEIQPQPSKRRKVQEAQPANTTTTVPLPAQLSAHTAPLLATTTPQIPPGQVAQTPLPAPKSPSAPTTPLTSRSNTLAPSSPEILLDLIDLTVSPLQTPTKKLNTDMQDIQVKLEGTDKPSMPGPVLQVARTSLRRRNNPLANMSIPEPDKDVLAPITNCATTSGVGLALGSSTEKAAGTKKGPKMMEVNASVITARSLYATEYLKTHSVTTAEFKAIYDKLDRATIKKFKALARARKQELATTAGASKSA